MAKTAYHHGDLRRTIVAAAVDAIAESGVDGWSLRELARRAGVSHAAPAYHFGDKTGVLTAIAAEGYEQFATVLEQAGSDLLDAGLAYVRFATEHPVHFGIMFQPSLFRADDPAVAEPRARAAAVLASGARGHSTPATERHTRIAAWSIAHGFASLWLAGAMGDGGDPVNAAKPVLRRLLAR
jgi:AcrR family transcriptional regulator